MDYFDVQIETELGEMVSYYVAAMDEAQAEDFAAAAFENGEIECMGIQIVKIYALRAWLPIKTIPHVIKSMIVVRIAVAKFESMSFTPILAKIAVSAAK